MTDHVDFEKTEHSPVRRAQQADLSRSIWADPDFEKILLEMSHKERGSSNSTEPEQLVMVGLPGFTPVGFAMVGLGVGSSENRPEPEVTNFMPMDSGPSAERGCRHSSADALAAGTAVIVSDNET